MKYRVLYAADIHIYRKHLVCLFSGNQFLVIVIIHIAQEIPGRPCPLRHGVGLSLGRLSTYRALAVHPLVNSSQWRFSGSGRLIGFYLRQAKRKFFFRYRNGSAVRTMHDRNWLAPVSLAGEYPVTQLVVHGCPAKSALLDDMRRLFLKYRGFHAIPFSGIDHSSCRFCIGFCHIFDFLAVLGDNLDDRNSKLGCKFKVTVVMSRNAHDGSCTIIRQNVIRQPDWSLLPVQRVDRVTSGKYAGLFLILHTVYVRLHGRIVDILLYRLSCLIRSQALGKFVLRRKYHEGSAIKGIWPGGVDRDFFFSSVNWEIYFRAIGLSNPVCLHLLNLLRPVQLV